MRIKILISEWNGDRILIVARLANACMVLQICVQILAQLLRFSNEEISDKQHHEGNIVATITLRIRYVRVVFGNQRKWSLIKPFNVSLIKPYDSLNHGFRYKKASSTSEILQLVLWFK